MRLRKQLKMDTLLQVKIKREDYISRLKHKLFLYFDFINSGVSKAIAMQVAGFKDVREFERAQLHFDIKDYLLES